MKKKFELGLYTFADMKPDKKSGEALNTHKRFTELMEEIELADQLGLDVFGLGEHHREEYAISSPAVVLGAAAVRTKNIKLTSAVTVLSSDDPVRVYQDFATIDQLSAGRAEIMAGRGSFIESFPLFGYDLKDYDRLFEEKLELLLKINENEIIDWEGELRPSMEHLGVYPRAYQKQIPVWLAVGGTPESAQRAAMLKLPMALAIIGGMPERFAPFVNFYKESAIEYGTLAEDIQLGINTHVFIGDDSQKTANEFYLVYSAMMNKVGKERGWPPLSRDQYEVNRTKKGYLMVGNADEVIEKILFEHELFGNTRFLAQMSMGTADHKQVMRSIELFGMKVADAVRKEIDG